MSILYLYNDELYHHGIKGMKWGVRRYRNEDGSLTPAGKRRYEVSEKAKAVGKYALRTAANVGRTALTDRGLRYVGGAAIRGLAESGHPFLAVGSGYAAGSFRGANLGNGMRRQMANTGQLTRDWSEVNKKIGKATEKDYARTFDYKKDADFASLEPKEKRKLSRQYATMKDKYGVNRANEIMYNIRKKGSTYKKETAKEDKRRAKIALAALAGSYALAGAGLYGYGKYRMAKRGINFNNTIASDYARQNGLNEVKGGFTPGFKEAARGNKAADAYIRYLYRHGRGH